MSFLVLVVDDEPDVEMLFRQQFRRDLPDLKLMKFVSNGESCTRLIRAAFHRAQS
jgi:CheY-like chemotaxis protein